MISKALTILKRYWWAIIILVVAAWLVYVGVNCHLWPNSNCTGFQGKTIWDVLELLIIPVTLAVVAAILDRLERQTDREIANQRAEQDREAANKRAEIDREIALGNQREAALQNYFDTMTCLILDKKLKDSNPGDNVREIAQIKTTTTIERLDPKRKHTLINFLSIARLINNNKKNQPIISLNQINLKNVCLQVIDLECANLMNTNLENADLFCAKLMNANLERAILTNSNLQLAELTGSSLVGVNMDGANLQHATLEDSVAYTSDIVFNSYTKMRGANFKNAILDRAILTKVDMRKANLIEASLKDAFLNGTELKDAIYNDKTQWPAGFDPVAAGAVLVEY